jgi:hypothetical protein
MRDKFLEFKVQACGLGVRDKGLGLIVEGIRVKGAQLGDSG